MEKRQKFSIWYVILGVWFVLLLQNSITTMFAVKTIPYSEFLKLLKENKVIEVAITADQIQGKLKDGAGGKEQMFRTVRVDPDTSKLLEQYEVNFKGEIESRFLPTLLSWVVPVFLFFGLWYFLMKRMAGQQPGFMSLGKNKAKIYVQEEIDVRFEDVAGVDEAKQELMEVIEFLSEPGKFTEIGGKIPKGILLVGPPGTGKTMLAKAVAGESGVPFFSMSGSEFVEMFVGLGAARVRDLFEQAKQKAPCIIFIDELDALGKARGFGTVGGHDEREQTLNQLLVEMDGFDPNVGVILLAATNRPEILDPALLRPGRFDRNILVDRPDKKGREEILKVHLKNIKVSKDVDLGVLAGMTSGMVGADLANLVNEAALLAVRRKKKKASLSEFEEAVERVIAGLEKKNRLINPKERKIVAYHEMGHAIVALSLPGTEPVQKISIIPRGIAACARQKRAPPVKAVDKQGDGAVPLLQATLERRHPQSPLRAPRAPFPAFRRRFAVRLRHGPGGERSHPATREPLRHPDPSAAGQQSPAWRQPGDHGAAPRPGERGAAAGQCGKRPPGGGREPAELACSLLRRRLCWR